MKAARGLLAGPGGTPWPWCLGMSVRGRAAPGQGRGRPQDGQVWPEDWEPGQGEAGVEPSAQWGRPQAGLGQGRDRCLPQGPSDKLTSSVSGGRSSPPDQAKGDRNPESMAGALGLRKEGPGGLSCCPGTLLGLGHRNGAQGLTAGWLCPGTSRAGSSLCGPHGRGFHPSMPFPASPAPGSSGLSVCVLDPSGFSFLALEFCNVQGEAFLPTVMRVFPLGARWPLVSFSLFILSH